jgi:hypothetical protein
VNDQINACKTGNDYWLQVGLRERYGCIQETVNFGVLERLTGEAVFLTGPHSGGLDLTAQNEFGHYNPAFLKKAGQALDEMMKDKAFNDKIQAFYDAELKNTFRLYFIAYDTPKDVALGKYRGIVAAANPNCAGGFLCQPSFFLQEQFRPFAEDMERQGYNVYEGFTAPGFWVRRDIDGTSTQFYGLLKKFMQKYDNEFIKNV